jgi:hypothetical protein
METLLYHIRKTQLNEDLIYKKSAENQMSFMCNEIGLILLKGMHVFVVSTHYSKSCELPVYYIMLDNGIKVIARANFYDWKISVESPIDLPAMVLPLDILTGGVNSKIPDCYLEGFRPEWSYDAYSPMNPGKKFTVEVADRYRFYVLIHALKNALPNTPFLVGDDKRSVDEIEAAVTKIYKDNGFYEMVPNKWDSTKLTSFISGWEILWRTHRAIENLRDTHKELSYSDVMDVNKDPKKMAEFIMKYPEVHEVFLREENSFKEI